MEIWESFIAIFDQAFGTFGPGIFIPVALLIMVGIMAQWALYDKCGLPGVACIVPIWNVIVFLKIMGRPWHHMFYFIVPPPLIVGLLLVDQSMVTIIPAAVLSIGFAAFSIKLYIELCQSFGKTSRTDYILVVLFNGFYVLNLGLSYKAKYKGPVYKMKHSEQETQSEKKVEEPGRVATENLV